MTFLRTASGFFTIAWGSPVFLTMIFKRTLCVRVNHACDGKSREDIVAEVAKAFSQPLMAVQIGSDTIRVTFCDVESFRAAHAKTHVSIFGINCVVQRGVPLLLWFTFSITLLSFWTIPSSGSCLVLGMLKASNVRSILVVLTSRWVLDWS